MPDRGTGIPQPDHVEPDFGSAAEAWMVLEMTMASMRYRDDVIRIAAEYERRLTAEREASP